MKHKKLELSLVSPCGLNYCSTDEIFHVISLLSKLLLSFDNVMYLIFSIIKHITASERTIPFFPSKTSLLVLSWGSFWGPHLSLLLHPGLLQQEILRRLKIGGVWCWDQQVSSEENHISSSHSFRYILCAKWKTIMYLPLSVMHRSCHQNFTKLQWNQRGT